MRSWYYASFTYNNNEGVIKNNTMNRLAGSLSAYQTGMNGRLRLDEGINTNFDSWHPVDNRIFERMTNLQPTFPVYNQDGSYAQFNGTNTENPVELNNNRSDDAYGLRRPALVQSPQLQERQNQAHQLPGQRLLASL